MTQIHITHGGLHKYTSAANDQTIDIDPLTHTHMFTPHQEVHCLIDSIIDQK